MPENGDLPARPEDRPDEPGPTPGADRTSPHDQGEALTDRAGAGPESLEVTEGAGEDFSKTMTFAQGAGPLTEPAVPPTMLFAILDGPPPSRLGRYQIRRELGQGGFGKVYVGYDDRLDREVAIKIPLRKLPESEIGTFLQEARRLARLRHPGIVTVYDVGVQDGRCFIVSDFVAGTSLREWLRDRRPTPEQSAQIVAAVADALDHAHGLGTIHRDVKPANIILDELLRPVLLDFGLALSEA
jgi:predicted Ser/Thr protein kinase